MRLNKKLLTLAMCLFMGATATGFVTATATYADEVSAKETVESNAGIDGSVTAGEYFDIYELTGDNMLLAGKTVKSGNNIGKWWMDSALKQNNGFEFKATVSDWEQWTVIDPTVAKWINGGYNTYESFGSHMFLKIDGYHDLAIYKTANGVGIYSKIWVGVGESQTIEIAGLSLAGTHTYKLCNVDVSDGGSQSALYIDGELVLTAATTGELTGYHTYVENQSGYDIILKTALAEPLASETYVDVYDLVGDFELIKGKTVESGKNIGKWWMENTLSSVNGFEFKATVSDWEQWTVIDPTVAKWINGGYNTYESFGSHMFLKIDGYHDLAIYKTANGVGIYSKMWVGVGESQTIEITGLSLAGTHTYKLCNVNNRSIGSQSRLYIDGELVFTAATTGDLTGYHTYVENQSGYDIVLSSAKYEGEQLFIGEPKNKDIFEYALETFDGGVSVVGAHSVDWNQYACAQAFDVMFKLDTTQARWDENGKAGYLSFNFGNIEVRLFKNHGDNDKAYVWIYDWSGLVTKTEHYFDNVVNGEIDMQISLVDVRYGGKLLGIGVNVRVGNETFSTVMRREYPTNEAYFCIDNQTSTPVTFSSNFAMLRSIYTQKLQAYEETDYSTTNWSKLKKIVDTATNEINALTTANKIREAGEAALVKVEEIWTAEEDRAFFVAKEEAKAKLASYLDLKNYYEEDHAKIATLLKKANEKIDATIDYQALAVVVSDSKTALDNVQTKEDKKGVVDARALAKQEIGTIIAGLKEADYSVENWTKITEIQTKYNALIEVSENIEDIETYAFVAMGEIDEIATKAEEEAMVTLVNAKSVAIDELENYVVDASKYTEMNYKLIQSLISDAKTSISAATTETDVTTILFATKVAIDKVEKIPTGDSSSASSSTSGSSANKDAPTQNSGGCTSTIGVGVGVLGLLVLGLMLMFVQKNKEN